MHSAVSVAQTRVQTHAAVQVPQRESKRTVPFQLLANESSPPIETKLRVQTHEAVPVALSAVHGTLMTGTLDVTPALLIRQMTEHDTKRTVPFQLS